MSASGSAPGLPVTVTIAHAGGLHPNASADDLRAHLAEGKFVWLDICGPAEAVDPALLRDFGLDDADREWIQRFGQVGRMAVNRRGIRAITWLAALPQGLIEVHFWSAGKGIITFWDGDPGLLAEVREEFVERFAGAARSHFHGAAILLQLMLGTLDRAVSLIDERIQALHDQVQERPGSLDFTQMNRRLEVLRDVWLKLDRYSGAVRSATVGIEAIPSMDADSIRELNEYVDHVEDAENRLQQRFQWGSDIIQDYATALAQRQGEQINRLAVVSIIFLPISFLTGFFGMNFGWIADHLGGGPVFLVLGVALPLACVGLTVVWLRRKGLL